MHLDLVSDIEAVNQGCTILDALELDVVVDRAATDIFCSLYHKLPCAEGLCPLYSVKLGDQFSGDVKTHK
jgi:hypothetical protein